MTIQEFQHLIESIYLSRDSARGIPANVAWLMEEVGELSRALRQGEEQEIAGEFADVLAWLCTLASIAGVDLERVAAAKYAGGCPKCRQVPCACEGCENGDGGGLSRLPGAVTNLLRPHFHPNVCYTATVAPMSDRDGVGHSQQDPEPQTKP